MVVDAKAPHIQYLIVKASIKTYDKCDRQQYMFSKKSAQIIHHAQKEHV